MEKTGRPLKIVSRKSALALWQAEFVKAQLLTLEPDLEITIIPIQTEGDQKLNSSLAKIGGKGLFVKALEDCLLNHQADIAVHSLKDVPAELPDGLSLGAILKREDARDAFVSCQYSTLQTLPDRACVGTSSLRRQSQLLALRPDVQIKLLRGNVDTRIHKLQSGDFDAIILAVAGLKRLQLTDNMREIISPDIMLPAVGQGALCIECRSDDRVIQQLIQPLHHLMTATCVRAERSMNAKLGGGCQLPVAGFAVIENDTLILQGVVGSPDGKPVLRTSVSGKIDDAINIGTQVAEQLLAAGAQTIINQCHCD